MTNTINIKKTRAKFLIISFFANPQGHLGKFRKEDTMLVKKAMGILEHWHNWERGKAVLYVNASCQIHPSTSSRPYLSDVAFWFLLLIPTFIVFVSSILLGGRPHSFCTLISHLLASIWESLWFGFRMGMNEQDCKMSLIELSLIFKKS